MLQRDQENKCWEVDVVPLDEDRLEVPTPDTTQKPERERGWGSRGIMGWFRGRMGVQSAG